MKNNHKHFMEIALEEAKKNITSLHGGPFGAVIVKDGEIIAKSSNQVLHKIDPTAHAEIEAIRKACKNLNTHQLQDCTIYTSCEPCPMCLGAIYWARPKAVFFAGSRSDAKEAGFDDEMIYEELELPFEKKHIPFKQISKEKARKIFRDWQNSSNDVLY